jgi:hypothetical protein
MAVRTPLTARRALLRLMGSTTAPGDLDLAGRRDRR